MESIIEFCKTGVSILRPARVLFAALGLIYKLRTVKVTRQFRWLSMPLNVILTRASREPAQNNGCGPWPGKSLNSPVLRPPQ